MSSIPTAQSPPTHRPPEPGWKLPPLRPAPSQMTQIASQSAPTGNSGHASQSVQLLPSIGALLSPAEPARFQSFNTPLPKQTSIFQLHSPPSPTMDKSIAQSANQLFSHRKEMARGFLPSPPNSGELSVHHSFSATHDDGASDPQLYSPDTPATHAADRPLFATERDASVEADISRHISATSDHFRKVPAARPSVEDYRCVAQVFSQIRAVGVKAYQDREWEWMSLVGKRQEPRKVLQDTSSNRRQLKPLAPKSASEARKRYPAAAASRSPRAPRKPVNNSPGTFLQDDGMAPPPKRRATVVKPKIEYDYKTIPDFAPAENTMDRGDMHAHQVKWNGANSIADLSHDPERHLLSQAELEVAEKLRLPCARFLVQKRKIFQHVIDILRKGKEFKKTNCQDCRLIDVNKLSTLWVFYNGVGWFNPRHYTKYLQMGEAEWLRVREGF